MGDRRVLLGTSAVLVGLGSALISGTAVAAAETGEADSKPTDTSASGSESSAPAPAPRRANTRTRPAPAAASDDASVAPAPTAARTGRPGTQAARIPVVRVNPDPTTDTRPVATPDAVPAATPESTPAIPAAAVSVEAPEAPSAPAPTVAEIADVPAAPVAYAAPAPAPAPAATLLSTALSGLGWQPAGGLAVAVPALAAFSGQRQSAAPAAVVGTPVAAAAGPDPAEEVADGVAEEVAVEITALLGADPLLPGYSNGVSGVQVGHSRLDMPGAFIGQTVAADWYVPTQADGTVNAQGVIWLQHGFGATNTFYSALAQSLAMKTNSIVVAPTLSSIPFTFSGGCLVCATSQEAAADLFLEEDRTTLVQSALDAGLNPLFADQVAMGKFVVAGHSAGGGFAAAMASDYVNTGDLQQDADLVGVLMYDGVSNDTDAFKEQVAVLQDAGKPIYTIAAPAQAWNAFGATTNALLEALGDAGQIGGTFAGAVLSGGSHIDSMLGVNPLFDVILQLVAGRSPVGNTSAVYTLGNGWINDMYLGLTPESPMADTQYGFYAGANEAIIMGPTSALALPTPVANQLGFVDTIVTGLIDAVGGLFGFSILPTPVNTGSNGVIGVAVPTFSNGVTGVRVGSSTLTIPSGAGYNAPADWYFPTQADGSVQANGVVWLQHGFLGFKDWYAVAAQQIAQETNSIVVVPNIFWFDDAFTGVAAAQMFLGTRSELNVSANAAGLQGALPENFILTGHSAGGRFATAMGAQYVGIANELEEANFLGVVMFDGVSRPPDFTAQLAILNGAEKPDYQIAAPPQQWNAYDVATEAMVAQFPDRFNGLQIRNGSHTDIIAGYNLFGILGEWASGLIVRQSPPGGKEAVRTLAAGWINDIYAGNTTYEENPLQPLYGIYGPDGGGPQDYDGGNQDVTMGQATAATLPAPPPVVINPLLPPSETYLGTWYEQGSVRQFFSIGLVNTKAVYSLNPDNTIKVENSGNYFGPNGPQSNITGSAVPVNAFNTRLNVGFFFGQPNSDEPGNYWILDYAPDYSWAIVGDANGTQGYILTRDQAFAAENPAAYDALVARAYELGVRRTIIQTRQFPESAPTAALPGPSVLPAGVRV